ncbi:MAG TPA: hypothetical protein VF006_30105 [Longimicrobium sp.]
MTAAVEAPRFVACPRNDGCALDLVPHRRYEVLPNGNEVPSRARCGRAGARDAARRRAAESAQADFVTS